MRRQCGKYDGCGCCGIIQKRSMKLEWIVQCVGFAHGVKFSVSHLVECHNKRAPASLSLVESTPHRFASNVWQSLRARCHRCSAPYYPHWGLKMRGSKELDLRHSPPFSMPKKLYTIEFPVLNDSRTHKSAQSVGLNPNPGITRWRVRFEPSLEKRMVSFSLNKIEISNHV